MRAGEKIPHSPCHGCLHKCNPAEIPYCITDALIHAAKGEVARATLYVYVMYGHSIEGNFSSLDLCLKWNREYPVTSWEMLRNNRNYDIQKNRNPFIDHPEFADLMFNK